MVGFCYFFSKLFNVYVPAPCILYGICGDMKLIFKSKIIAWIIEIYNNYNKLQ